MKKLMMFLFLLAVMSCGQHEEVPDEGHGKMIAGMSNLGKGDWTGNGGNISKADRVDNSLPEEEADKPFRTDMDSTEMFTVRYWYKDDNVMKYGIYAGDNIIEEEIKPTELNPHNITVDINRVKIPGGGEINNNNKYDIYTVKHHEFFYTLRHSSKPSNGVDGNTFIYYPTDHADEVPKGTWIATISIVVEGGDKNNPLQMYDIYI